MIEPQSRGVLGPPAFAGMTTGGDAALHFVL